MGSRHGVSLLEVMFALGVIVIGLLGVVAVVPVGLSQLGTGTVADRASRTGLDAVEEIALRGMARSDQWLDRGSTAIGDPRNSASPPVPPATTTLRVLRNGPRTSFCLDPRFVARHENSIVTGTNPILNPSTFPYTTNNATVPRMMRISLRDAPDSSSASIMTSAQADSVFVTADDLVFDLPDDKSQPPEQVFGLADARRQFEGDMSWMATLVPKLNPLENSQDSYTLSVVVFYRRDPLMDMFIDANLNGAYDAGEVLTYNERDVNVVTLYSAGLGGGDVQLEAPDVASLELKSNDWLLLMGNVTTLGTTTPLMSWYRIVEVEQEVQDGGSPPTGIGPWQLDVTLVGPDWPVPASGTRAALIKNVVSVYEKTIRLESSNLWAN